MGNNLVVNTREGHAVQILGITHLDTAQVETHDGRIVAADILHVAAVGLVFPRQAIERIVLMAHHITSLLQGLQTLGQLLGNGFLLHFLFSAGYHDHY